MMKCPECGSGQRSCRCGLVSNGKLDTDLQKCRQDFDKKMEIFDKPVGLFEKFRLMKMLCPSEERKAELKAWKEQQKADKEFMEKFEETHGLIEDKESSDIVFYYLYKGIKQVRIPGADLIRYIKILKDKD